MVLETEAGPLAAHEAGADQVRVDMGPARLDWREIPLARAMDTLHVTVGTGPLSDAVAINMGNPHAVFFVDDAEAVPLAEIGPQLETDPLFPERANIGVAQRFANDRLRASRLGAGRRPHPGLRHRRLRRGGRGRAAGAHRARCHRCPRRRRVGNRLARRRPRRDDRPHRCELYGGAAGMSGLEVITMGCRLNAYESEVMRARAQAAGLTEGVIVNTCAVTGEAERQARQAIRRARRQNPEATIIATGCAAQLDPAGYAAMPEVDRVVGNREKLTLEGLASDAEERVSVGDIMAVRETAGHLIAGYEARSRAFVQVQNGCDHRCTFCIIPFARGPSRSVPLGAIAAEVRALVAAGHREVALSGVDLGHYGADLPGRPSLGEAVRRLLQAVPELPQAQALLHRPSGGRPGTGAALRR